MVTLLSGNNSFEISRRLDEIRAKFAGSPEIFDGETLSVADLPDLLIGISLFASQRLVIIKNASLNKDLWSALGGWVEKVSSDTHLVLVEASPDKRTSAYKAIKKTATCSEFSKWKIYDTQKAEKWLIREATDRHVELNPRLARYIVERVGADQWTLVQAIDKLLLADKIDERSIDNLIDPSPSDNVFELLRLAIIGDNQSLATSLASLKLLAEAHMVFGMIASQAFQLAVIVNTPHDSAVDSSFGIHPYALSQMTKLASRINPAQLKSILRILAKADLDLKTSSADPWQIIEVSLQKITRVKQ
jgi:DNA polymerase III delta subunit